MVTRRPHNAQVTQRYRCSQAVSVAKGDYRCYHGHCSTHIQLPDVTIRHTSCSNILPKHMRPVCHVQLLEPLQHFLSSASVLHGQSSICHHQSSAVLHQPCIANQQCGTTQRMLYAGCFVQPQITLPTCLCCDGQGQLQLWEQLPLPVHSPHVSCQCLGSGVCSTHGRHLPRPARCARSFQTLPPQVYDTCLPL